MRSASVNWSDVSVLSAAGVNWSDVDVLSDTGVNWVDLGVLSAAVSLESLSLALAV